jgi:hypothetical protein
MVLTKPFSAQAFARALESWTFLDIAGKIPVLASLFGDVFLQDHTGYWFLDSIEGSLSKVAATRVELESVLGKTDGQDKYLLAGLAIRAERGGLALKEAEVYDFAIPPVLGGSYSEDNVVARDFVVAMTISGQIHDQVRNLPPGAPIKRFTVDGRTPQPS